MKNKKLELTKYLLTVMLLLLPTSIFANEDESEKHEPGQLLINPRAIHDAQEGDHAQTRSVSHEIAPFLFLDEMREAETQRVDENKTFITTIREGLFLEEERDNSFDTRELIAGLFQNEGILTHRSAQTATQIRYFEIPVWVTVIGITTTTGLFVYIAVLLGKKLGHIIHKKKEDETNG